MDTSAAPQPRTDTLAGNIRDLRHVTLAEIIRARRADSERRGAGEFNSSI